MDLQNLNYNQIPTTKLSLFKTILKRPLIPLFLILVLSMLTAYFFYFKINKESTLKPTKETVAKVGDEIIYQKDVDALIIAYTQSTVSAQVDWKKVALERLISESVILQGAKADGLVTLDDNTFNSKTKDYSQRKQLVEKITNIIDEKTDNLNVTLVGIWFYNPPASMSAEYAKDKELAKLKIQPFYDQAKGKKMTMTEVIEAIKKDTSLEKIDTQYKGHAGVTFSVQKGQPITFDPEFDALLWNLKNGEITDLYLTKIDDLDNTGHPSNEKIENAYLFAQVNEKIINSKNISYNDWLNSKRKIYEVVYY